MLMRVKEKMLVAVFLVSMIFFGSYASAESKIYILDLNYDKGDLSLLNIFVKPGYAPDKATQPEVGYTADVISFKGRILYSFKFEIPLEIYAVPPLETDETGGLISLDRVNFTLLVPYFENGKTINIYDPNGAKKLSVDIQQFATGECSSNIDCGDNNPCTADLCTGISKVCSNMPITPCCGNGICEAEETYPECSQDCSPISSLKKYPVAWIVVVILGLIVAAIVFIRLCGKINHSATKRNK